MKRVLILCTGNSCRSQMAEAIWRELGGGEWEAFSAGSDPTGDVHPLAIEALRDDGLEVDSLRSKSVTEFASASFDEVITVCDAAADACPVFPGARARHWPFPDPAHFEGSLESRRHQFAVVRDDVRARIDAHLQSEEGHPGLDARVRHWCDQWLDQLPGLEPAARGEYEELIQRVLAEIPQGRELWKTIPGHLHAVFGRRGWAWNGIYLRVPGAGSVLERLVLRCAWGPPVCSELERTGGVGSSGMCFDAVLTGQALVADSAKGWHGYHSCDAESGLATQAGLVVPIRDRGGRICGVWDLDSTQPLLSSDLAFMGMLLSTLSSQLPHGAQSALKEA